ncbi:Sua5/YciO/YrdC/YwlC family protein [Oceanicoccus sagamiensis]|uniref:Threonylcarbamoyl-AMP synthase n=1 Tax=Oceanicoccus sagamiensis TaxID=716816 RepID=A0A1X9NA57_9GAMM|nr:Sua5/YciO/YrdC/YwlC family protein [Oceanicoccus sagamiensis]ARN74051.1 hypothetical protein BST96_07920 [Oceanicoccus sagamiensis]
MANNGSTNLRRAADTVQAGGVIAYPTETVWGFGCDPDNANAVKRLLALKQRPVEKGLILLAASPLQFAPYLEGLDDSLISKFSQPAPSPITWLVPDNGRAKACVKGDFDSVALRVSTSKLVVDLCHLVGGPIVSTSANATGQPTCEGAEQIRRYFGDAGPDFILPGELNPNTKPSEIRDLISDKVIRGA